MYTMKTEENWLDLNVYPAEHGEQPIEESSTTSAASVGSTRLKRKKGLGRDEDERVYECRFCFLKFCKSQALGGHMNRHRQERETEMLNRARRLVFCNESFAGAAASIGLKDLAPAGSQIHIGDYQHVADVAAAGGNGGINGEAFLRFRPVVYPNASMQQYIYPSFSAPSHSLPHSSPPFQRAAAAAAASGSAQRQAQYGPRRDPGFTCYEAPLSNSSPVEEARPATTRDDHGAPRTQSEVEELLLTM